MFVASASIVLAASAHIAGCASQVFGLSATPVKKSTTEVGVGLSGLSYERGRRRVVVPVPDVAVRRGLGGGWDIGGRFSLASLEVSARGALPTIGGARLAISPALRFGYHPATNNFTDLLSAQFSTRLISQFRVRPGLDATISAIPSVGLLGPVTIFRGRTGASRVVFRPGAALGLWWTKRASAARFGFELGVHPAWVSSGPDLPPEIQFGIGVYW